MTNILASSRLTVNCPLYAVIACLPAGHDARHSHPRSYSKGQLHSAPVIHFMTFHCLVLHASCHLTLHMLAWLAADYTKPVLMPQLVLHTVAPTAWSACCWLVVA